MKKLFLIVLIILLNIFESSSQEKKTIPLESFLTFNIMSPTFSFSPRWNLGYIKPINDKWLAGLEFGYGNYKSTINFAKESRIKKRYKLWEIRSELFYILNPNSKTKKYISTELFYINHTDTFYNENYTDGFHYFVFDKADYRRQKVGVNFNFGMLINFSNKIGLNISSGLGIRNRNIKYSNIINLTETIFPDEDDAFFETNTYKTNIGNHLGFNYALNLKLFYKF